MEAKSETIANIVEDTDVHFSWLLLCLDEELSKELLGLVVEMLITIQFVDFPWPALGLSTSSSPCKCVQRRNRD